MLAHGKIIGHQSVFIAPKVFEWMNKCGHPAASHEFHCFLVLLETPSMFALPIVAHCEMFRKLLLVYPILDIARMLVCSGYVL